jgi:hypothetical protein
MLVQQDENVFAPPVQELPVEFPAVIPERTIIPDRPPQGEQCFLDSLDHGGHLLSA